MKLYEQDCGRIPTMEQGLTALCSKPTIAPIPNSYRQEGYLESTRVPDDPWKNRYIYLVPGRKGEKFEVFSHGSDGAEGGTGDAADISSSDP
jgi:general secretion pathway protein G